MLIQDIATVTFENTDTQFRENTTLGALARKIQTAVALKIPADIKKEDINTIFMRSLDEYLSSDEGSSDLGHLQDFALKLCGSFNESFITLKTRVKDEVDSISQSVFKRADELVSSATGYHQLNGELVPAEHVFEVIKFDIHDDIEQLVVELADKYQIASKEITPATLKYFINKVHAEADANLSEDVVEDIAEFIYAKRFSDSDFDAPTKARIHDYLRAFVYSVSTPNGFERLKAKLFGKNIMKGFIGYEDLENCLKFLDITPILDDLADSNIVVSETSIDALNTNFKAIDELKKCVAIVFALADEKYKGILVIGPNLINKQELENFKELGGSLKDISDYLRLRHNSNPNDVLHHTVSSAAFPINGISTKEIFSNIGNIQSELMRAESQIKTQLSNIKHESAKRAFTEILSAYVNDVARNCPEMIPQGYGINDFVYRTTKMIKHHAENLIRTETSNIEDAVYSFYLRLWYEDSLVSTIYYKLGAEAIAYLETGGVMNDDVASYLNVVVMSDILTAFIADNFIEPMHA